MNKLDMNYYGHYAEPLISAQNRMLSEIRNILAKLTADAGHAPAEHIRSRIKNSDSLREKLKKQGYPDDAKTGLTVLSDIIGVRIITHFIGDVYAILELIKTSECWEIITVKDYISNPKPNGYRSLHIILRLAADCPDFESFMTEIQLRTIAMDCWASLEHQMKYKKNIKNTELIESELKRCADEMASTDLSMQTIRELIQSQ